LLTEAFRRQGEEDMARLHEEDKAKFYWLFDSGRNYFFRVYKPKRITEEVDRRVEAEQQVSGKGA
ncbi:MAG: hypothetical protein WBN64_09795, partial [Candidatus Deferrimicrobium sp.]